jgi:hypothetical protein
MKEKILDIPEEEKWVNYLIALDKSTKQTRLYMHYFHIWEGADQEYDGAVFDQRSITPIGGKWRIRINSVNVRGSQQ